MIQLAPLLLGTVLSIPAPAIRGNDQEHQIAWQPSLIVAREIATREGRPLFVALNMDGESASERIVREQYRDVEFVVMTRHCVCVVGSLYRHNPRDYDDEGRRILCPRLGKITCGEHIELEPILFDRFLDGDRVAPRHAYIEPDGTKTFDLFLLFDLVDLETALRQAIRTAVPPPALPTYRGDAAAAWRVLLANTLRTETNDLDSFARLADLALEHGVESEATNAVLRALRDDRQLPGECVPVHPGLLFLLASLDGNSETTRTTLLAWHALFGGETQPAIDRAFTPEERQSIGESINRPVDLEQALQIALDVQDSVPLTPRLSDPRKSLDDLAVEYSTALEQLDARPGDLEAEIQVGLISTDYAREKIDYGEDGVSFLLADAETFLERGVKERPDDLELRRSLAKAYFVAAKYEDEERVAFDLCEASPFEIPRTQPTSVDEIAGRLGDDNIHEALRWLGDASARMMWDRQGNEPGAEIAGIADGAESLLYAAASPRASETDWVSAASFFSVLGLIQQELAVLDVGLQRFPTSAALRGALHAAYATLGRPELSVEHARKLAAANAGTPEGPWWVGYASILQGDWERRMEQPDRAIATYDEAIARFEESREINPEFEANCKFYEGLCMLSQGFAHLLAQRQPEASRCLVKGIQRSPAAATVRDGLDREALDLLDGALEFRTGRLSPVDPALLLYSLEHADPGNAFWARSISDTELREALRADGRGELDLGDELLARSIIAADRALETTDDDESRTMLAQCRNIFAERLLARGQPDAARPHLLVAAPLLEREPPLGEATLEELQALAAELREELGDARPIAREGR